MICCCFGRYILILDLSCAVVDIMSLWRRLLSMVLVGIAQSCLHCFPLGLLDPCLLFCPLVVLECLHCPAVDDIGVSVFVHWHFQYLCCFVIVAVYIRQNKHCCVLFVRWRTVDTFYFTSGVDFEVVVIFQIKFWF